MKKLSLLCMALLIASVAVSASAQEVKEEKKGPSFTYGLKGAAFGITGAQDDFEYDYSHIRVRPSFTIANDNVKGVVTFEIDQDFGKNSADTVGAADPGTDNYAVEVKHAYIEVKDTAGVKGLSLMGGLNGYKFPVVVDNDYAMGQVSYDFGIGKVFLSYIKIEEETPVENTAADVKQNKDVDVYALDVPLKFGVFAVRGGIMSAKGGDQSTNFAKADVMNYAINISGDVGMAGFNVTGAYLKGDMSSTVSTSSYALDLNVDVKPLSGLKLSIFGTYASGDKAVSATEDNGYFYNMNKIFGSNQTTAGKASTGAYDGRLFLLEYGYAGAVRDGGADFYNSMDNQQGWMSYGISAEYKLDKLTLFAQFGMASLVEKNVAGGKSVGSEIDLKVTYEIAAKTLVYVEYATIIAGDVIVGQTSTAENGYQGAFGLSTSI